MGKRKSKRIPSGAAARAPVDANADADVDADSNGEGDEPQVSQENNKKRQKVQPHPFFMCGGLQEGMCELIICDVGVYFADL